MLYTEWALKEPNVPAWTNSQMTGAISPARLEPEFRLHSQSHGFSDVLTVDQLLTPIQVNSCLFCHPLCSRLRQRRCKFNLIRFVLFE